MTRKTRNIKYRFFCRLFLFLNLSSVFAFVSYAEQHYTENIILHISRNILVPGQPLFYKTYCLSSGEEGKFHSKVVYVELINSQKRSCSSQVLYLVNQTASSVLKIPDTLATGLYYLKAYTQWMINSGVVTFATEPLFIYNQHSEDGLQTLQEYELIPEPEIYIKGGKLISNLSTQVSVGFPGLFGNSYPVLLEEIITHEVLQSTTTNSLGFANFNFIPSVRGSYQIIFGDSVSGRFYFPLPDVEDSGYSINVAISGVNELTLSLYAWQTSSKSLLCRVLKNDIVVWEKQIDETSMDRFFNTGHFLTQGCYDIKLSGYGGAIVAHQAFFYSSEDSVVAGNYKTRSHVKTDFDLSGVEIEQGVGFSVSISKYIDIAEAGETSPETGSLKLILPKYLSWNTLPVKYPAEDMGMIYYGNIGGHADLKEDNNQVLLAFTDSVSLIRSAKPDAEGNFNILLNECGSNKANLYVLKNDIMADDEFKPELNSKFYYTMNVAASENNIPVNQTRAVFDEALNESQRFLMKRAFQRDAAIEDDPVFKDFFCRTQNFYGKPDVIIFPGDFIFLPNFEEISREIVPRVRYQYNKGKGKLFVTNVEEYSVSENPIILLDGVYETNPSNLYDLNSDNISRIEVQSGLHISGNMLYDALIAVYTTADYRKKNRRPSDISEIPTPGYSNNNYIYNGVENSEDRKRTIPVFEGLLYWDPMVLPGPDGILTIEYNTSDEEGKYLIEVKGISRSGVPVHFNRIIEVGR